MGKIKNCALALSSVLAFVLLASPVVAKPKKKPFCTPENKAKYKHCGSSEKLSTSTYDLVTNATMNGAIINKKGQVVDAKGRAKSKGQSKGCTAPNGQVSARGAGGCLTPFLSVACDISKYPMGTIFCMPDMPNVKIPGTNEYHPKCVKCDDRGPAICGEGRFDIFTGKYGANSASNPFGYHGPMKMTERKSCSHAYYVIREGETVNVPGLGMISHREALTNIQVASGERKSRTQYAEIRRPATTVR